MRVVAYFTAIFALAACEREKSFDERYEETTGSIENRALAIDRGLENHSEDAEWEGHADADPSGRSESQD